MYKSLNAEAIGIKNKTLPELVALAATTGFAGVDFSIREAKAYADAHSVAALRDLFATQAIKPAQWGLPVNGTQNEWNVDQAELKTLAGLAAAIGSTRCATWCPSWSDTRDLEVNRAFHVKQLRPVAQILADHGISLGLEFLGPKTLLDGHKFAFIRTMSGMLGMAEEIGTGNVGLLLDAWHLYTSGGTLADLLKLKAADVVHVHINDAPGDIAADDVQDTVRFLPLETGVIDLAGFMKTLAAIGYDGPVVTEPFNARINNIAAQDPVAAAHEVSAAMSKLWKISGLQ